MSIADIKLEAGRLVDIATKRLDPEQAAEVMGHIAKATIYEQRAVEASTEQAAGQFRLVAKAERGSAQDILAKEAKDRGDQIAEGLWAIALTALTGRRVV